MPWRQILIGLVKVLGAVCFAAIVLQAAIHFDSKPLLWWWVLLLFWLEVL